MVVKHQSKRRVFHIVHDPAFFELIHQQALLHSSNQNLPGDQFFAHERVRIIYPFHTFVQGIVYRAPQALGMLQLLIRDKSRKGHRRKRSFLLKTDWTKSRISL
jgi:hypothetical protein